MDLVFVHGHLVGLLGLGPEIGHGETLVEVCAEVIHDTDGEHDVHAELSQRVSINFRATNKDTKQQWEESEVEEGFEVMLLTLNTSRFKPPILIRRLDRLRIRLGGVESFNARDGV